SVFATRRSLLVAQTQLGLAFSAPLRLCGKALRIHSEPVPAAGHAKVVDLAFVFVCCSGRFGCDEHFADRVDMSFRWGCVAAIGSDRDGLHKEILLHLGRFPGTSLELEISLYRLVSPICLP